MASDDAGGLGDAGDVRDAGSPGDGQVDEPDDEHFSYHVRVEDEQDFIDEFGRFWTDDQFDLVSSGFKSGASHDPAAGRHDDGEQVDPITDPVRARDILLNPRSEIRICSRPFVLPLADYLLAAGAAATPEVGVLSRQYDFYLLEFGVDARPARRERFSALNIRLDHPGTELAITYQMSPDTGVGHQAAFDPGTGAAAVTVELDESLTIRMRPAHSDAGGTGGSGGSDRSEEGWGSGAVRRWTYRFLPAQVVALGRATNYADWTITEPKLLLGSIPFVTVTCVPRGSRSLAVAAAGSYQIRRNLSWWRRPTTVEIKTVRPVVLDLPPSTTPVTVRTSPAAGPPTAPPSGSPTAVVITMVDAEYRAVRPYLGPERRERVEHETVYEVGTFDGRSGRWTVAATQIGPGNDVASAELERAIRVFSPDVVLLVGVAGGRKDVQLGDVVVADAVYDYESGKALEHETLPRIKTENPSYGLVQRARQVTRDGAWQTRLAPEYRGPAPGAVVKPIAAGDKLVAHDRSATARLLELNCGDAVAVEMEGTGFLRAAYRNPGVRALVVRGISDLLTGKSAEHDRRWQPVAAARAAAFAFEVLSSYDPRT